MIRQLGLASTCRNRWPGVREDVEAGARHRTSSRRRRDRRLPPQRRLQRPRPAHARNHAGAERRRGPSPGTATCADPDRGAPASAGYVSQTGGTNPRAGRRELAQAQLSAVAARRPTIAPRAGGRSRTRRARRSPSRRGRAARARRLDIALGMMHDPGWCSSTSRRPGSTAERANWWNPHPRTARPARQTNLLNHALPRGGPTRCAAGILIIRRRRFFARAHGRAQAPDLRRTGHVARRRCRRLGAAQPPPPPRPTPAHITSVERRLRIHRRERETLRACR